jgi:arginyl-tRNA synthetase
LPGKSPSALARLETGLSKAAGMEVELERPSDPVHGDYATNAALRAAPGRGRAPRELAEELAVAAAGLPEVERVEVAGPGFVNLVLAQDWFRAALGEVIAAGDGYAAGSAATRERVQVEMVSANPTGPITVASARNGAIGDSVARLLARGGHEVEREYYYNDAGVQMERFRESVEAVRRGEEPPEDGYRGDYVRELAGAPGDPVAPMLKQIEATLQRFRIPFDSWALQSALAERLPELLPRLDTYEQGGAVWARSSAYGDEKDRVLIRSETGGPTYRAADVVYLVDKLERGFDRAIYVLGADHHGTMNWYAAVARMLGYDPDRVEVLLYQLVHLMKGGEQTKMSKRRGDVVFLDDFIDEIGVDAARWYLVNRSPDQTIEIDIDLAAERSEKNPVYYVQYAHARIAGIMRNAAELPFASADPEPGGQERELVKRLLEFPQVVAEAAERRAPHMLTVYAIRVADDFHRFYHHNRVISEDEVLPFRRDLARATQTVIATALDLIGVDAPERM